MRGWVLGFCLIGCGGVSVLPPDVPLAPATAPPRPPVVIPPPPADPVGKPPTGTLSVGETARWPADLPVKLDSAWTPTMVVSAPDGSFVQATHAGGATLADLRAALSTAGCGSPDEATMPGSRMLSCPPSATLESLIARLPDRGGAVTIAWKRVTP